jgi:polysaccharide pyruvyl transferase WcaK-like protein
VIHHVYATQSNVGDWLSARGIPALLTPEAVVEHLCDERFVDETLERLAAADPTDLVVIGGGGLFMDYFRPFWEGLLEINAPAFCVWGAGVCDLKREASSVPRAVLERLVEKSLLFVVRDDLTLGFLPRAGGAYAVPCPAMAGLGLVPATGTGLLHAAHKFVVGAEAHEAVNTALASFAGQTGRELREVDNRIRESSEPAYRAVLAEYARAELVVSSRLHGCIIALAMGRKVLAVSGDRKVEAFMRAAGLQDWVCDVEDLGALPQQLHALPQQRSPRRFIDRTLWANRSVANQIRALHRGPVPRSNTADAAPVAADTGDLGLHHRWAETGGAR